jgi:hypothetical protein
MLAWMITNTQYTADQDGNVIPIAAPEPPSEEHSPP